MVWLKVEARVAIGMELQGKQGVKVSAWKVTPELKTGWGFMGSKMLSCFGGFYEIVGLEGDARAVDNMEVQG